MSFTSGKATYALIPPYRRMNHASELTNGAQNITAVMPIIFYTGKDHTLGMGTGWFSSTRWCKSTPFPLKLLEKRSVEYEQDATGNRRPKGSDRTTVSTSQGAHRAVSVRR